MGYGPVPPAAGDAVYSEAVGPEAPAGPHPPEGYEEPRNDGYVVVLGGGLARAPAYFGALKELEARGVRIKGYVAVEMGAVAAALFCTRGANALEWQLAKLRRDTFVDLPLLRIGDPVAEGKKMEKFLRSALGDRTFRDCRVPLHIGVMEEDGQTVTFLKEGRLRDALAAAVAIAPLMKNAGRTARRSAVPAEPMPVEHAKSLGIGPVLAISAGGSGNLPRASDEFEDRLNRIMEEASDRAEGRVRDADGAIVIDHGGVGYLGIDARAELAYKGRKAAEKWHSEAGKQ